MDETQEGVTGAVGLRDFQFKATWIRAYELTYARAFQVNALNGLTTIYAGAGIKYYHGFIFRNINISTGLGFSTGDKLLIGSYTAESVSAYSDDINLENAFTSDKPVIDHVPFMDPVGQGFGIDLGITAMINPGIMIGVSVTDIGNVKWEGKTKKTFVAGTIEIDSIFSIPDIDSIANSIQIIKEEENSFTSPPPTSLHIGFGIQLHRFIKGFPGEMNFALEAHQGLNDAFGNLEYPRLAFGIDWKPGRHWPVIMTGLTNNSVGGADWSVGLGYELGFAEIYISSPDVIQYFDSEDLTSFSLSICWHFWKNKSGEDREKSREPEK
jgi:hypothetical protein